MWEFETTKAFLDIGPYILPTFSWNIFCPPLSHKESIPPACHQEGSPSHLWPRIYGNSGDLTNKVPTVVPSWAVRPLCQFAASIGGVGPLLNSNPLWNCTLPRLRDSPGVPAATKQVGSNDLWLFHLWNSSRTRGRSQSGCPAYSSSKKALVLILE